MIKNQLTKSDPKSKYLPSCQLGLRGQDETGILPRQNRTRNRQEIWKYIPFFIMLKIQQIPPFLMPKFVVVRVAIR